MTTTLVILFPHFLFPPEKRREEEKENELAKNVIKGQVFMLDLSKIQSAKILLLPPIYEIIMLPSNHPFYQYCDSNIGLFSIAPLITRNPFCIIFGISSLLLFLMALSLKLSLFLALKGDSEKITVTFGLRL